MDWKGLLFWVLLGVGLLAVRSAFGWCSIRIPRALAHARERRVSDGLRSANPKRQAEAIKEAKILYLKDPQSAVTLNAVEQIGELAKGPLGVVSSTANKFLREYIAAERERISNLLECPRCGTRRYKSKSDKRPTGRVLVTPACEKCGFHFSMWLPDELPLIISDWRRLHGLDRVRTRK